MLVGEAPGAQEAARGEPFVGQAGKLLRSVLRMLSIDVDDLYITNVVKCRPPGNKLKQVHINACVKALESELRPYVKAGVPIFAMGRTAQDVLIGASGNRRGQWFNKGRVYGTWHPAYILRQPSRIYELVSDLSKIKNRGPVPNAPVDIEVVSTIEELHAWYKRLSLRPVGSLLCIDLETDQVNWWEDKILCIGIAWSGTGAVVIAEDIVYEPETRQVLTDLFYDFRIVGHNFKFDMRFLKYQLHVDNVRCDYDSLIAHYVLNENERHGLKALLLQYFDIPDYEKDLVQAYLRSRNDRYSKVPRPQLYQYCALDVAYNFRLWERLEKDLKDGGQFKQPFLFPLMAAQGPIMEMELHGILVDRDEVQKLSAQLRSELDARYQTLSRMCGREFNPNSWKQVGPIMYDHYNMPVVRLRGQAKRSTDHKHRVAIMEKIDPDSEAYQWLKIYGQYKTIEKMRSSYVDNLEGMLAPDGRVHPDVLAYGTEVGRISVRNPAIQTIPRAGSGKVEDEVWGERIRSIYAAPEGYSIMEVDYSQAELRTAACLAEDKFLLEVYQAGRDLHSEVSIAMYGPNYTKEQRVMCKMFNFSYLYGGSEHSFARDAGLDIGTARAFVRRYNEVMGGLTAYKHSQLETMQRQGYVESIFGRRRRFLLVNHANQDDARKAAVHAVVAGTASDLTIISLMRINQALKDGGHDDTHIIITVHDSNILEVPNYKLKEIGRLAQGIMVDVGNEYFPQIPWKVDVEVGPVWGRIKELELALD